MISRLGIAWDAAGRGNVLIYGSGFGLAHSQYIAMTQYRKREIIVGCAVHSTFLARSQPLLLVSPVTKYLMIGTLKLYEYHSYRQVARRVPMAK